MRTKRRTAVIPSANRPCRRVAILAVPPINELDVVGPFQVFGTVNRLFGGGGPPYEIEVVSSVREGSVHGYSGLSILCHLFYQDISGKVDTLLVAGGLGARSGGNPEILEWIMRMSKEVRRIGSVCTGAFL